MATETYQVEANLRLVTGGSENAMSRLGDRLTTIGDRISGTQTAAGGLFRQLIGFGAAYVGINAIAGAFRSAAQSAVSYANEMESLRISTSAVMSAVDHIPFEVARQRAGRLFDQYQEDAITSVATTRDLVMISNAIMGPLRGAGQSMETVRDMTNMTVTASTALGVDLQQASRDMQLMINGSAGMQVRLYQMLHSTGAIAENAHAFNQLSSGERIARLQHALGQFAEASAAYGASFAGVTSTFSDNVSILRSTFFGPAFASLTAFLGRVNDTLIANRQAITGQLRTLGTRFASQLDLVFANIFKGFLWVGNHWTQIVRTGERFVATMRHLVPLIGAAAANWAALSAARSVIGAGFGLAGGAARLAGGLGYAPGGALGSLFAMAGGGAAAGEGAGFGALSAAMAGLAPLVAPIVAGFVILASVGTVVTEHLNDFAAMFESMSPTLGSIGQDFLGLGTDLFEILHPALTIIGDVVVAILVPGLMLLAEVLHFTLLAVRGLLIPIRAFARALDQYIVEPLTGSLMGALRSFADGMGEIADFLNGRVDLMGRPTTEPVETAPAMTGTERMSFDRHLADSPDLQAAAAMGWLAATESPLGLPQIAIPQDFIDAATAPSDVPTTVNDFRGSRITVHQEFREADPDRVAIEMMSDIAAQAESRITSPYRSPFSQ